MKVPYLNRKIREAFNLYCDDFIQSNTGSIKEHKSDTEGFLLFKYAYSLFVLLESLNNSDYFNDPTKEILLCEAIVSGSKKIAEKTARQLSVKSQREEDELIRQGAIKRQFTPYFREIYSDTLMLLNSYYTNNYRGCYISVRCILENVYRHIYYKDHPQEYWAIMQENQDYDEYEMGLTPRFYREYLKRVSYLKSLDDFKCKGDMNPFTLNDDLYRRASAYVHASKLDKLSGFDSNASLVFDKSSSQDVLNMSKDVVLLSATFLICCHKEYFLRFNDYAKSLIIEIFDGNIKHRLRSHLNI